MSSPYILEMKNINKSFYGTPVLQNVNFSVKKGEVHVLLGENGAGKSTLMKILSGVYKADSGQIVLDGKPVTVKSPDHSLSMGIGMVYQELSLIPYMSIAENVWLGHMPKNKLGFVKKKKLLNDTKTMLTELQIDVDINKNVSNYDLGIQQLCEIIRVISRDVKIVILDEPTSSLSTVEVEKLFQTIRRLKEQGIAFVYITHKLDEVAQIGDCVTVLRDGSTIDQTLEDVENISRDTLVTMMVGRPLEEQYPKIPAVQEEVMLLVEHLTDDKFFYDVSFDLKKGEVLGVAGLVGAGSSELAEAIFGLRKIRKGTITYCGQPFVPKNPKKSIQNKLGFVTKDRKDGLALHMSISTNICMARQKGFSKLGFRLRHAEKQATEKYIKMLNIKTKGEKQKVRDLSGGNQQKVAIAKWNCSDTLLYIMDDPTRGVDVGAKVEVYNLINQITAQGASVLLISSDMPELLGISDRIMVMKKGRITAIMNADECTQELILEKAAGSEGQ